MSQPLDTLAEATYGEITFPISALSVEGGHDFAEHTAYLRRGADMEPCGQKAYSGSFTIPCINTPRLVKQYGELFRGLREGIVSLFEDVPIAALTLPGYRTFTAGVKTWASELDPDRRNGTDLKVTFAEHNATAALLDGNAAGVPANTPASVAGKATAADAAMLAFVASGWAATSATIAAQLARLEDNALPFQAVAECFRLMLAPVDANLRLPLFAPAGAHAAVVALLSLRSSVYDLRSRYQPTLSLSRRYIVPAPMALWEVALSVYGDPSRTALLRAANPISDCLFINAGTVLTILPAS